MGTEAARDAKNADELHPLRGRVAVVTGGTRGIGAAICRLFAQKGADIVTTHNRHPEEIDRVLADIRGFGRRAHAMKTDVADREMVDQLMQAAVREMGRVDIVVANAAINHRFPIVEQPWEEIKKTVEVTMFGALHAMQLGAAQMVKQGSGGSIIAISSVHAEIPFANSSAYNMSKAGLNHLCRTMAQEVAPQGIRVNSIEPGWIDTEGERDRHTEEDFRKGIERIPMRRLGRPEEVAKLALYLASSDADYVTGSVFRIDGGMTLAN